MGILVLSLAFVCVYECEVCVSEGVCGCVIHLA